MIFLNKNTYKLNFTNKQGIALMLFSGVLLVFVIIAAINSLSNYDHNIVVSRLRSELKPTIKNVQGYVRLVALITTTGNTLVIGTFAGMVWWGISRRQWGLFFGWFWLVVFLANAVATPYYSNQKSWLEFTNAILNGALALIMILWIFQLIIVRNRIKQTIARKKQ